MSGRDLSRISAVLSGVALPKSGQEKNERAVNEPVIIGSIGSASHDNAAGSSSSILDSISRDSVNHRATLPILSAAPSAAPVLGMSLSAELSGERNHEGGGVLDGGVLGSSSTAKSTNSERPLSVLGGLLSGSSVLQGMAEEREEEENPGGILDDDGNANNDDNDDGDLEACDEPLEQFDEPVPQSIVDEFPAPLSPEERHAIVANGSSSLERVIELLTVRRDGMKAEVADALSGQTTKSESASSALATGKRSREDVTQAVSGDTISNGVNAGTEPSKDASPPPSAPSTAPQKRRIVGISRTSNVFANLRNVLGAAKREEQQHASVERQRDRIAKETQLQILQKDLEEQEKLFAPLREKKALFESHLQQTKADLVEALDVYAQVNEYESRYCSSFFLKVEVLPEAERATTPNDSKSSTDTLTTAHVSPDSSAKADLELPIVVFFCPGKHSSRTEGLIRDQVNVLLPEYRRYRERIQPTMEKLAAKREELRLKREAAAVGILGGVPTSVSVTGADSDRREEVAANKSSSSSGGVSVASRLRDAAANSLSDASACNSAAALWYDTESGDAAVRGEFGALDMFHAASNDQAGGTRNGTSLRSHVSAADIQGAEGVGDGDEAQQRAIVNSALSLLDDFDS